MQSAHYSAEAIHASFCLLLYKFPYYFILLPTVAVILSGKYGQAVLHKLGHAALKRICHDFDKICTIGYTGSCYNDNSYCSQWWKVMKTFPFQCVHIPGAPFTNMV